MFNERKAAQIAAFFIQQAGGTLNVLKLMKLLYLADREAMNRYDEPLTYDAMVSMKHGPVLSRVLECINGFQLDNVAGGWDEWISDRANHEVSLRKTFSREDLDELSEADMQILHDVFAQFGHMNQWQLSEYTHDHCKEWQDPQDSTLPISYRDVLLALGKSAADIEELHNNILATKQINQLFANL